MNEGAPSRTWILFRKTRTCCGWTLVIRIWRVTRVHHSRLYDLGDSTTTLQDFADYSTSLYSSSPPSPSAFHHVFLFLWRLAFTRQNGGLSEEELWHDVARLLVTDRELTGLAISSIMDDEKLKLWVLFVYLSSLFSLRVTGERHCLMIETIAEKAKKSARNRCKIARNYGDYYLISKCDLYMRWYFSSISESYLVSVDILWLVTCLIVPPVFRELSFEIFRRKLKICLLKFCKWCAIDWSDFWKINWSLQSYVPLVSHALIIYGVLFWNILLYMRVYFQEVLSLLPFSKL